MCVQLAMSQRRKSITGIVIPALSWLSLLSDTDPSCHWCVKMGDESRCQVQQSYTQQLRQSRAVQQAYEEGLGLGLGLGLGGGLDVSIEKTPRQVISPPGPIELGLGG